MSSTWIQEAIVDALSGDLDLIGATVKVMLLKDSYTPNPDHKLISDLVAHECDATNYTGGFGGASRKTLGSKTVTADNTNNRAVFDAADPSAWSALGGSTNNDIAYAAVVIENTSDADSRVVDTLDFRAGGTTPYSTNGGDFSLAFHANGIAYINV